MLLITFKGIFRRSVSLYLPLVFPYVSLVNDRIHRHARLPLPTLFIFLLLLKCLITFTPLPLRIDQVFLRPRIDRADLLLMPILANRVGFLNMMFIFGFCFLGPD